MLFSQGDPTSEEQYLLQKLNRARQDPTGEGQRLADWLRTTAVGRSVVSDYHTDPAQLAADFAALPAAPPLAFDAHLLASAQRLAADNAGRHSQDHIGSDGSTPQRRVKQAGYDGGWQGPCH